MIQSAQDQALNTNNNSKIILEENISGDRLCEKCEKTVTWAYKNSVCPTVAKNEYLKETCNQVFCFVHYNIYVNPWSNSTAWRDHVSQSAPSS
jgi:hypothetical protein